MGEAVITALISGAVTLAGVLAANGRSQAVTETKLEELTREVRAHNNFAQRIPILEHKMDSTERRISELENIHKRQGSDGVL